MDTNVVNALTDAASSVTGDMPTVIAAGMAIFVMLFGLRYLKRALRSGAR